jgi:hypothetical protein
MMSHRLLTTSVNMLTIVNSPLKIGLKVEHEGAYYKIINFYRQQNSVNQYIIQSLSTGKTKRVFRHQICDADYYQRITLTASKFLIYRICPIRIEIIHASQTLLLFKYG